MALEGSGTHLTLKSDKQRKNKNKQIYHFHLCWICDKFRGYLWKITSTPDRFQLSFRATDFSRFETERASVRLRTNRV